MKKNVSNNDNNPVLLDITGICSPLKVESSYKIKIRDLEIWN